MSSEFGEMCTRLGVNPPVGDRDQGVIPAIELAFYTGMTRAFMLLSHLASPDAEQRARAEGRHQRLGVEIEEFINYLRIYMSANTGKPN